MWLFNPAEPTAQPVVPGLAVGRETAAFDELAFPPLFRVLDVELAIAEEMGFIVWPEAAGSHYLFRDLTVGSLPSGQSPDPERVDEWSEILEDRFSVDEFVPPAWIQKRGPFSEQGYAWQIAYNVQHVRFRSPLSGLPSLTPSDQWTVWYGPPSLEGLDPYVMWSAPADAVGAISRFDPLRPDLTLFTSREILEPAKTSDEFPGSNPLFYEFPDSIRVAAAWL